MKGAECNKVDDEAVSGGGSCRWNPTKDQIRVLEGLYKQGVRTPSSEQIQHITARLRVYGHIEGKNVFYWFQNHKARQRQKQKQESIMYANRFLHAPVLPTFIPPPTPNGLRAVVCNPSYAPCGYYPPFHKVLLPPVRRPRTTMPTMQTNETNKHHHHPQTDQRDSSHGSRRWPETLRLFPLHPTGILLEKDSPSAADALSPSTLLSSTTSGEFPASIFSEDSDGNAVDCTDPSFINLSLSTLEDREFRTWNDDH